MATSGQFSWPRLGSSYWPLTNIGVPVCSKSRTGSTTNR